MVKVSEPLVGEVFVTWVKLPGVNSVSPSCSLSVTGGLPATSFSTSQAPRVINP